MIAKTWCSVIASALMISTTSMVVQAEETGQPTICALTQLLECVHGDTCQAISPESIGAPRFLQINASGEMIKDPAGGDEAPGSVVTNRALIDGKLILQGTDPGQDDLRDGVGWTLSVAEDTGRLVLTAAGDDVAYVAFGDCIPAP
ncbi:MAG: hypothetical protein ACR2Q4_20015 [Geminicoccaceae bacterium]